MRLDEGNIFEAMRLVLPEHRAVMSFVAKQNSKRERPVLAEDQMEEMQYILAEALEQQRKVRITFYHPYDDVTLEGWISSNGTSLMIHTPEDISVKLSIMDIIGIELI